MKKRELKKLPDSIDLKKAEEIFSDRLAELIVMTLDYQHEQKLKLQDTKENKNHAKPRTCKRTPERSESFR